MQNEKELVSLIDFGLIFSLLLFIIFSNTFFGKQNTDQKMQYCFHLLCYSTILTTAIIQASCFLNFKVLGKIISIQKTTLSQMTQNKPHRI